MLQHGEDLFGPPPLTWPGAFLAAHDDLQEELEEAESSDDEPESANAKTVLQSDPDTDSDPEPELAVDVSVKYLRVGPALPEFYSPSCNRSEGTAISAAWRPTA